MKARNKAMPTGLIVIIAVAVAFTTAYVVQGHIIEKLRKELDVAKTRATYHMRESDRLFFKWSEVVKENSELKAALVAAITAPTSDSSGTAEEVTPLLPPQDIPTNTYRCEQHDLFIANSEQAILQDECFTEPETGIRYYLDTSDGSKWYCAALAGAYGIEIGHCYIFTLANGTEFPVMLSDFKHDISDTKPDDYGDDDTNYDGEKCVNVIEFVVDMPTVPKAARDAGTMSALDKFGGLHGHGGNIIDVKDAGRRWKA